MRVVLFVVASAAMQVALVFGRSPQQVSPPRFELVSIKPVAPAPIDEPALGMPGAFLPGGRYGAFNVELEITLHRAYPQFAKPGLLIAPEWISREKFDIDARAGTDVPIPRMRLLLRQLLVDRFAMQSHTEMRLVDTYQLVLARADGKLGPRVRPASAVCDEWNAWVAAHVDESIGHIGAPPQPKQPAGAIPCGMTAGVRDGTSIRTVSFGGAHLSDLAPMLTGFVGRTVTDRTGLTGRFDIELEWADIPLDPGNADGVGGSLANALEDQLGVKLQRAREMAEVLVVDRIERPTPN